MTTQALEGAKPGITSFGDANVASLSPSLLTEIFDHFEEAVVVANTERRIVYVNSATEKMFGHKKTDLYGEETRVLYAHEEDFSDQGAKRFNVVSVAAPENYRVAYRRADGQQFLGLTTAASMRSPDGEVVGFVGIVRPARSPDQSLDTLQKIHNVLSDVRLSHDEKIEALLHFGLRHFGLKVAILSRIIGDSYIVENCVDYFDKLKPSTEFELSGTYCVHAVKEDKTVGFHYAGQSEIRDHPCYENFKLESYIGTPIKVGGNLYGTINFSSPTPSEPFCKDDFILMELLSDSLEYLLYKRICEQEMVALAQTDELTGLPNRRATMERLRELVRHTNQSGSELTILALDIDHFKKINDQWGHAAGDEALIGFAREVSSLGRKTDFCGRIGGEEFVFILPGSNVASGIRFYEKLRARLSDTPIDLGTDASTSLTVSAGLAMLEPGESLEAFLARADDAMYQAKQEGRNRVCQ